LDISKEIDKKLGAEREKVRIPASKVRNPKSINGGHGIEGGDRPWMRAALEKGFHEMDGNIPVTLEAKQWEGWGTCLKPANEPILLARKPISEKTIAENVMKWGTGGLNIEGCRIPTEDNLNGGRYSDNKGEITCNVYSPAINKRSKSDYKQPTGRFPANIILDEEAAAMLDEQSGVSTSKQRRGKRSGKEFGRYGRFTGQEDVVMGHSDSGGASRFFYCAKASGKERGEFNKHPTVKPIALMEYLIKLVTPPEGIVLDPFLGSGTTALAALNLGRFFIGIELNEEYCEIARRRIEQHKTQTKLFA
jgi:site-specific DNA-methyltransferase (adenine-specific)